jgi:16S rRNA C1402 (ribose-2'-O) methylase RsmI
LPGGFHFNKAEAVAVSRELAKIHSEIAFAEIVEISKLPNSDAYELKIRFVLDVHGRESVNAFLIERDLKMREENGFIIIHQ